MNLKNIFIIIFSLQFSISIAQEKHPNDVRKSVYDHIIQDLKKNRQEYVLKEIYIDATVNKFDNVELTSLGVQLSQPEYINDVEFCKILNNTKCVEKIEIDQFTLSKVYKVHKDQNYVDFYGIYAPLDNWYNVISNTFKYLLQNDKPTSSSVTIPVKNVYFKAGDIVTDYYFYKFDFNKEFEITAFQKINF